MKSSDLIEAKSHLRRPFPRGATQRPAQTSVSLVLLRALSCPSSQFSSVALCLPDHKCLGLGLCVAACACPLRAQQCTIPVLRKREEWTKARSCYKPDGIASRQPRPEPGAAAHAASPWPSACEPPKANTSLSWMLLEFTNTAAAARPTCT